MSDKLVKNNIIQYKALKLRIYPTEEQEIVINKTFGCCRQLYNEHLQERNEFYINNILPIKKTATETEINNIYKTFKPKTEKEWKEIYPYMKEVPACALQQARIDCDNAFINFFKSKNGTRKGKDYDCKVIKADRYFPSSQLCSSCGWQYKDLKLKEREWVCKNCGSYHIRDVNAAVNLKNYVPWEARKLMPVESDKISSLAELALQEDILVEAGSHLGDRW